MPDQLTRGYGETDAVRPGPQVGERVATFWTRAPGTVVEVRGTGPRAEVMVAMDHGGTFGFDRLDLVPTDVAPHVCAGVDVRGPAPVACGCRA